VNGPYHLGKFINEDISTNEAVNAKMEELAFEALIADNALAAKDELATKLALIVLSAIDEVILMEEEIENDDNELDIDDETLAAHEAVPLKFPSYFKKSDNELVFE